jgi:hypothetical protein
MAIRNYYFCLLLLPATAARAVAFEYEQCVSDLLEIKELVGLTVVTPALDGLVLGTFGKDSEQLQAALQDAVACLAAAREKLSDEQIIAYSEKLEAYWAEISDTRAPRPPFIDPAEGQLAPDELTYFPRDVVIARNLEVGGDLTVDGDININTSNVSFIDTSNSATFNCLDFKKSRNGAIVQNNDSIGCLNFQGFDGAAFVSGALIEAQVDSTPGLSDMPGRIVFSTSPDGSAVPTEKMRINNAGIVSLSNNLELPNTTSATSGVITKNGVRFIHNRGTDNTFVGRNAGNIAVTASRNSGFGADALAAVTSGGANTAAGAECLENITTGANNSAFGSAAMQLNQLASINTALGSSSLQLLVSGNGNIGIGFLAGSTQSTLTNCTFVGTQSDASVNGLTNATALGSTAIVNASNKVRIGNGSVTVIEGQVAFTASSDERLKRDIMESPFGLEFISRIKPYIYKKECGENLVEELGFSAQNVDAVAHELGLEFPGLSHSADGFYYMRYNDFIAPMVKAIQELKAEIELLKASR